MGYISTDTKLTAEETARVARYAELDLRDNDLSDVADVQRVLQAYARQSGDQLFKRAANGSDAQFKRIVREVRIARSAFLNRGAEGR